ncbi:hypothetical protein FHR92_005394 [Fontibacillus solani]|uniref:Uncharacterized protein n=1 Tax=Fontibacillus solani TaxID=1572857 RepID=A0A7W3XUH4_9BACL|nr:hypothetical protein [Fontibacillus solani]
MNSRRGIPLPSLPRHVLVAKKFKQDGVGIILGIALLFMEVGVPPYERKCGNKLFFSSFSIFGYICHRVGLFSWGVLIPRIPCPISTLSKGLRELFPLMNLVFYQVSIQKAPPNISSASSLCMAVSYSPRTLRFKYHRLFLDV